MPRSLTSLLLGAALLGLGAICLRWVIASAPAPPFVPPRVLAPVPVTVRTVVAETAPLSVRAYGTLVAARTARIAPEIGGRLSHVNPAWREGARIEAGQELFRIDTRELEIEIARTEAQLSQARSSLAGARQEIEQATAAHEVAQSRRDALAREEQRATKLADDGYGRMSQVDQARAARAQAELGVLDNLARAERARQDSVRAEAREVELTKALELARYRLDRASVRAPFTGRLAGRAPGVGSSVTVGEVLVELHDITTLHLQLAIPEDDCLGLVVGARAAVHVPSREDLDFDAVVGAVGAMADPALRTLPVEVDLPNAPVGSNGHAREPLAAGTFAEAEIFVGSLEHVVVIDRRQMAYRNGRPVAYVLDEDESGRTFAAARALELGRAVGEGRVVRDGLAPDDRLIIAPLRQLTPGASVEVAEDGR